LFFFAKSKKQINFRILGVPSKWRGPNYNSVTKTEEKNNNKIRVENKGKPTMEKRDKSYCADLENPNVHKET